MKLAAFVVLGLVVTFTVYFLVVFWILHTYLPRFERGGCGNLGVCLLFVMPFSLLLGSILTGFLSYTEMNTKWGLIAIAPGLWLVLVFGTCLCPDALISVSPSNGSTSSSALLAVLYGLFLYLVSLGTVALGYFLRSLTERRRRPPQST